MRKLILLIFLNLVIKIATIPISTEVLINHHNYTTNVKSKDCINEPCSCCSENLLKLANQYSFSYGIKSCQPFMKNLYCTLACLEESSDLGMFTNDLMLVSVCKNDCTTINDLCSTGPSKAKVTSSNIPISINSSLGVMSIEAKGNIIEAMNTSCSAISLPNIPIGINQSYSLGFIPSDISNNICITSKGIYIQNFISKNDTLPSINQTSTAISTSKVPPILLKSDETPQNIGLTSTEAKCGFCFTQCCCWPVWVGSIFVLIGYLLLSLFAIKLQSTLFSQGLRSQHFWKGGGYWLVGSGSIGLVTGLLVGGLVTSCASGALSLGGSLCSLFMSILLVGRLGSIIGALGGLGTGSIIGVISYNIAISWGIGMALGFLLGLIIGFAPIARTLRMNDRYIRKGLRMREIRRSRSQSNPVVNYSSDVYTDSNTEQIKEPRTSSSGSNDQISNTDRNNQSNSSNARN